jgi:VCBS repeat-containing protein
MRLEPLELRQLLAAAQNPAATAGVVIIDSALVASIPQEELSGSLLVAIDSSRDAIDQISTALAGLSNIDVVRVISHGSDGSLWFGDQRIDSATFATRAEDVAGWRQSLSADGDILLYGCSVASTDTGRRFVQSLAELTAADVAASSNRTGVGGDEMLEFHVGDVTSGLLAAAADYERADMSLEAYTINQQITSWTNNMDGTATIRMSFDLRGRFYYAGGHLSDFGWVYMYVNGQEVASRYMEAGNGKALAATVPLRIGNNEVSVSARRGFPTSWQEPDPINLPIAAPYYLGMPSTLTVPVGQWQNQMYVVSNAFGTPTIRYSATNLPRGVSIDSRGVILGIPETGTAGNYNVVLQATNGFATATHTIAVTVTNQAPSFASATPAALSGATEGTPFTITHAALAAALDESDPNNDPLSFRIESLLGGTLTKNGTPVTTGSTLLAPGESLVWTPPPTVNGTLDAFTVKASDGALLSATAKTVRVSVGAVNDRPTFSQFSGPVASGTEDTVVPISLAALLGAADEADIDGSVTAFVVKSVTTGTLRIGTSDATATPWNATTNAAITSSLNAYWTPAANANGAQSAFTAVARDDGGLESLTPAQAVVSVAAVNDSPTLTSVAVISGATASDPFEITYATLANAANAADLESDGIAFRIEAVSTGALEKWNGSSWTAVTAGTTLIATGEKLRWTPAAGTSGLRNAFTVKAWDGQAASATAIQVRVDGDRWRVRPWTDAASSGISTLYNYTHAYSFGAVGSFAVNGLTFTGLAGANPAVTGRLSTTGFGAVVTGDANNLADASRSLAGDAVSTSAASASVTLRGLAPGGRYVLSLYTVGRDATARLATLSSAMGQLTVDQNTLGTDNGVRIDYQYLADAAGSVTITLAVPSAAFSIYGLANREVVPAIGLYAPSTLTYDATPKAFQGYASAANPLPFISGGTLHSAVLKADGTVAAFGTNQDGQTTVPLGLTNVVAVSAGGYHTLALKSDGTVAAWGNNFASQSTVPAGLSNVVAIAAGGVHSLALRSDGTVVAWGSNSGGQTNVPAGLTGVVAIAAGSTHSLALKSDGTVVAWGYGFYNYATPPAGLTDVVAISAGEWHSLALKSDGTVVAWGNNGSFQSSVPAGLKGVVAVSAGTSFSLALKADGTIVAWGDRDNYGSTVIPAGLSGVVAIDAGAEHSIALKSDGTVVTFGWIRYGQQTPPATFGPTAAGMLNSYTYSYQGRGATAYAASATPPTNAGDYTVTATASASGNTVGVSRDFTIAKVTPAPVYYTRTSTITYGAALTSDQVDTLPSWWWNQGTLTQIPGTTTFSPAIGTVLPAGTHTLQLTFVPTDSVNFNPAVATSTITVQKATVAAGSITLTPPASLTYTGAAKAYSASATGVAGFTFSYSGRGTTAYGPSSVAPTYAGDYTVTATINDPNYQGSKSLDFTVAKAVPAITAAPTASALTFGQTLASSTLSGGTASVPGSFAFAFSGTSPGVGTWSYDVVFTPTDTVNYATAASTVSVTVDALVIPASAFTFTSPANFVYSGSPKFFGSNAQSPSGSSLFTTRTYSGVAGTTYGPSATAPTNVGSYAVTATVQGPNFAGSATRTFTITQAVPTVTWATPANIAYGTALSATQQNATASVAGSFVYTPASGTVLAAGARTLEAVFTPTDTLNYTSVTTSRPLQVTTTSLPISLVPPPLVYNGTAKQFVVSQMAYLSSGWDHSVALNTNGTVTAFGSNSEGQTSVPGGLSGVVQVSAGAYHSVAVKSDGTLVGWGSNSSWHRTGYPVSFSPLVFPISQITNATAVAAGGVHTVVLRADGTVTVFGESRTTSAANVPEGLANVTAVAAGWSHAVALKSDGTVAAWGFSSSQNYGQSDVPAGLTGVMAIAAGGTHSLALKADGTVVAWGNNSVGQATVPAGLNGVVALTAGYSSSFALKADGSIVGWGMQSTGPAAGRQLVAPGSGVVAMSSDANGNLRLLKSDGTVTTVDGTSLATGIGFPAHSVSYAGRAGTTYAASATAPTNAGNYAVTVTSTDPNYSASRTADFTIAKATPAITTLPQAAIITEGQALSAAVLDGGVGSVPGTFAFTSPGFIPSAGSTTQEITFTPTDSVNYASVTATVTVRSQGVSAAVPTILTPPTAAALNFGQRLQASTLSSGVASVPGTFVYSSRLTVPNPGTARQSVTFVPDDIASYAAVTILVPLTVYDGVASPLNVALVPPPSLTYDGSPKAFRVARGSLVSAGNYGHFLVVKSDGTVGAFGDNSMGQLNVPAGLSGVVAVAAGEGSAMALKADGTVVEWGSLWMGTAPAGLSGVVAIARGTSHSLALKADGTVVAWGDNSSGQRNVPTGLTGVVAIAGSVSSSFALKSDGTVVAWGTNAYGQMDIPAGLAGVVALSASSYGPIAALKADGTVVCWGKNTSGQATVPVGLSGVVAVAAGENHTVALKADGTVVAWGGGTSFTPTGWNGNLVPWNLANVVAIDASSDATYAIRADGSVVWWGQRSSYGAHRVNGEIYRTPSGAGVSVPEITPLLAADSASFAFSTTYTGRESTTYAASATPPTEPGDYSVTVTGTDPDFAATKTLAFTIAKASPAIASAPTAAGITYGQSLVSATLSGGAASVDGSFAFAAPATIPNAGTASQTVVFTPTDTARYLPVTLPVSVAVAQATPTLVTLPTATTIAYGQTLASAELASGLASVPGTFAFMAPGTAPTAGTAARSVTFTPTDTVNYAPITASVDVLVIRATPSVTAPPTSTSIRAGQSLANAILSGGTSSVPGTFAFADTSLAPGSGTASQDVVFTPTDSANYAPVTLGVAVRVRSFDPGDVTDIAGEAGGVANAAVGFDAVGNVIDGQSNYDGTAIAVTAVTGPGGAGTVGSALAGSYGSLTLRADGSYVYVVNDTNPTVQALPLGATLQDDFSYTVASATDSATAALRVTVYGGNDAPTFSSLSSRPLKTVNEDTEVSITLAELLAAGNETDLDGTVVAFVVTSLAGGTLRIGADSASALPWDADSNSLVDATQNAYWTPAADANGTLPAFAVVVRDDGGASSPTPVTVQIAVTPVNDAPALSPVEITFIDTIGADSFAPVSGSFTASDVDADSLTFGVTGVTPAGDVFTQTGSYGTLVVNRLTGAYTFTPNATAINATTAAVSETFPIVVSDGTATTAALLTISIAATDDRPTLSALESHASPGTEDSATEVSFADLLAAGNEADVDGTVTAFVVTQVKSGRLVIGSSAAMATEWNATTNHLITNTLKAFWTPDANAFGLLEAFSVVARDDGGNESTTPVTYRVSVASANDAPSLSSFPLVVGTTAEDTQAELTFAALAAAGDQADIDGTVTAFVVTAVTSGTLTIGASAATATPWAATTNAVIRAGQQAYWTPAANASGTLAAFTVVARDDGGLDSPVAVPLSVLVSAVNDAPVNTVPASQTIDEDTDLVFSAGNGTLISVADLDVGSLPIEIALSVTNGALTLAGTTGLTFTTGDGTADATLVFSGTRSDVNAALAGLVYRPAAHFHGSDLLTLATSDLGGSGSGGVLTDTDMVAITVVSVNDAPTTIALSTATTPENLPGGTAVGTLSTIDDDAGDTFTYTLVAGTGDTDNAAFTIAGNTLKTVASFDFETKSSYAVRVRATDAGGLTHERFFAITVSNVNEAAAISLPEPFANEFVEDVAVDGAGFLSATGRFSVVDPDAGEAAFRTTVTAPDGQTNLGSLSVDTSGNYVYKAFNSAHAVQALRAGTIQTDVFVIRALDGTARSVSFRITGAADTLAGAVADGYLAGATLFADSNANALRDWIDAGLMNGVWDAGEGEAWTTTDAGGNFSFDFGDPAATLVTIGGTDISTGMAFTGSLSAPAGSTIVNPLTTLVAATIKQASLAPAAAVAAVRMALGLPAAIDLTTYDPLAQTAGDATALQVQKAAATVANLIVVSTNNGIDTGATLGNLAALITASPTATVDLQSSAMLTSVLTVTVGSTTTPPPAALVTGLVLANTAANAAASITEVAESQEVIQQGTPFTAPAITSLAAATFATGIAGSFQFVATGYPAPTFSFSGTLPAGVTLSTGGLLSGTPAAGTAGAYAVTVIAANGINPAATQVFTLTITQTDAVAVSASANRVVLTLAPMGVVISSLHTAYDARNHVLTITAVQPGSMAAVGGGMPGVTVNSAAKTVAVNLGVFTAFAGISIVGSGGADGITIGGAGINLAAVTRGSANQSFTIDTHAGATDLVMIGKPITAKGSGSVTITTSATDPARGTRFAAGVTTSGGSQAYAGPVTLLANSALTAGAGISFNGTVNGAASLSLAAGGAITFADAVGTTTALKGLAVSRAASVAVNGAFQLNGTGTALGTNGLTIGKGVNNFMFSALGIGSRTIQNFSGSGIRFAGGSTNSTVTGVISRGNGTGISFDAGSYAGTRVQNNTFDANARYGVVLDGATNLLLGGTAVNAGNRIINSTAWKAYSTGIQASGNLAGTRVQGNTISGNAGNGVVLVAARGITIGGATPYAGNTIHTNGGFGLLASGVSNDSLVQGNAVTGNRMGAVNAKAAKGLRFS